MPYKLRNDISTESLDVTAAKTIHGNLEINGDVLQTGILRLRGPLFKVEGELDSHKWVKTEQFATLTQAGLDGIHDTTAPQGLGTNVISENTNILTTGTTISDEERTGLVGGAEPFDRALSPRYRNSFKLSSITDVSMKTGFINSAGEEVTLTFDSSVSPNFRGCVDGEYVDSGLVVAPNVYFGFSIVVEADGTVTMTIESQGQTYTMNSFTKKMTANAHGMEYSVKTLAAAAKALTTRIYHVSQDIM